MKKITFLIVAVFFAATNLMAQYVLSFDSTSARAGFAYTVTRSSEFPHVFNIENIGGSNMYRFFAAEFAGNGPIFADYSGIEIEFDYPTKWDIPANLQFFFSTEHASGQSFGRGYYPLISTLIGESETTKATINFGATDEAGQLLYPNLFKNAAGEDFPADNRFSRIGIRSVGPQIAKGLENTVPKSEYTVNVKLKQTTLIKKDGSRVFFNYASGGVWNENHSYRLYGQSASFTLSGEGFIAWNLSAKQVKYINVYLSQPLTAETADKLSFEYDEFKLIDAAKITGKTEGSSYISIDAQGLAVGNFSFFSPLGGVDIAVSRIELSDSAAPTSVNNLFANDKMPEFVNVYSIQGQLVRQKVAFAEALNGLPKGVYIVHNKKVAVVK